MGPKFCAIPLPLYSRSPRSSESTFSIVEQLQKRVFEALSWLESGIRFIVTAVWPALYLPHSPAVADCIFWHVEGFRNPREKGWGWMKNCYRLNTIGLFNLIMKHSVFVNSRVNYTSWDNQRNVQYDLKDNNIAKGIEVKISILE